MGRKARLPEPWRYLAAHSGGAEALASKLGVSYVTLWRWAHGLCCPAELNAEKVRGLCDKHGLTYPEYRTLGVGDA